MNQSKQELLQKAINEFNDEQVDLTSLMNLVARGEMSLDEAKFVLMIWQIRELEEIKFTLRFMATKWGPAF